MIRNITNFLRKREQIAKESLGFEQVQDLICLLNRQTVVTVSAFNIEKIVGPFDVIDTVLTQLMPFGKNYFDAEHAIFLDKKRGKEFHYVDMCIGQFTKKGEKLPAFYKTTVSYSTKHD